ncbi:hypothetical protein IBF23_04170 [Francisella tularensis]|nr:hypothetical protein [Francisella tularensis]
MHGVFCFQKKDGIGWPGMAGGLGDVYKRQTLSIFLIYCYAYSNQEPQHKIVNKISFDSPRQINLSKS